MITLKKFKEAALAQGREHNFDIRDISFNLKVSEMLLLCTASYKSVDVGKVMVSNSYTMKDVVNWMRLVVNTNSATTNKTNTVVTEQEVLSHLTIVMSPSVEVEISAKPTDSKEIYAEDGTPIDISLLEVESAPNPFEVKLGNARRAKIKHVNKEQL